MPQSIWKGAISFGLVSIPVRLFSATEEKDISFRQVHREDGGRIRYKRVCSVDGEEVAYADIAKGYELPDGEMVVLDDDDFANLPITSSRSVEVLSFVPAAQIDAVQMNKPYYCDPTGDVKPYILLRDALEKADRVAVVKVALRQRERLAMLRARDGVLVLQTLLWPDEVREPKLEFDDDVTVRPQELAMAESYINALSGDFEPDEFTDDYRGALEEVIEAKVAGREVVAPAEEPACHRPGRRPDGGAPAQRGRGQGTARRDRRDGEAGQGVRRRAARRRPRRLQRRARRRRQPRRPPRSRVRRRRRRPRRLPPVAPPSPRTA